MSLKQTALLLAQAQFEFKRRRCLFRREYDGREYGYFDWGWHDMRFCPRCHFLKTKEAFLCSRCAADLRRKDPGWRGSWSNLMRTAP